jgi:mannose-6-phosphate isomerase-like protein (cupin superfamily)
MECMVPHDGMPTAPHLHPRQVETYLIQDGSIEVLIGRTWSTLRVGESATVPAGSPHAFRNRSGTTASFLNVHAPALRFEEYFRTVHRLAKAGKLKGALIPGACSTHACW